MFKKTLIGIGVMLVTLTALGASDCEVETDTPTSEAPPVAEAPAETEAPAAVEPEACYLTASCPLANGWTLDLWTASFTGTVVGLGEGNTPEAEALAGCVVDVTMLRMTPDEAVAMGIDGVAAQMVDIYANECSSLFEAFSNAGPQA